MFSRKQKPNAAKSAAQSEAASKAKGDAERVTVKESRKPEKSIWQVFPGPKGAEAPLRVAVDRSANADLVAHAKESLEAEVCGVLAGQICEDDEGLFVHVEAIIRGTAASQGSTHVTFTQATWKAIHESLERDHPKMRIVGWYHTHPGFGVEFSEMDLFIQRNFFSGPTQIALVTDPVSGAMAICVNTPQGIEYLPRYWVEGREQQCRLPERVTSARESDGRTEPAAADTAAAVKSLETRVSQLALLLDEQRESYHRFLLFVGMIACIAFISAAGYTIYSSIAARREPPKVNQIVPVPVQIGDRTVLLGVGITSWDVPDELNALYLQIAKLKLAEDARAAKEAEKKGDTNQPATSEK